MMFQYLNYILELTLIEDSPNILYGECKEVDFSCIDSRYDYLISVFKTYIDNHLANMSKKEDKKVDLWAAINYNEQLEQKFEEILEYLQQGQQVGYRLNFNVQEKLKKIDKQITSLLEEQSKLNNQEDKPMKIEHESYILTLEITDDGKYIETYCDEIGFKGRYIWGQVNYQAAIERFKSEVERYVAQKEIDEKKMKEAREIPDLLKSIDEKLDSMRQEFRKSGLAFNILGNNREETETTMTVDNDSKDKILHTYHQHLKSLSYRKPIMTTTKLKEELKDIYELFGDLLGFSEQDVRREYFEGTSTKE